MSLESFYQCLKCSYKTILYVNFNFPMQPLTCVVALHDNEVKLEMTLSVKETQEKYQVEEKYVVKSTTLLGGSLPRALYFHFVNHKKT